MARICGKRMVEPSGIEPLTSTLPVLLLLNLAVFLDRSEEQIP